MTNGRGFSKRHGYRAPAQPITVREDAPRDLRVAVIQVAYDVGLSPTSLRAIVCRVLRVQPNESNWSEYPNVAGEVNDLIDGCPWYRVYDVIEAVARHLVRAGRHDAAEEFEEEINQTFIEHGIGWQMSEGQIVTRGSESFETQVRLAVDVLENRDFPTAQGELHEALSDLSRRPTADLTGALQHAMAALECVAREVVGDHRATLGEILKRYPGKIPAPLDTAVEKAWGFASEHARHLREGRDPAREEVELVVGVAAAVATYLAAKHSG